MDRIGLSWALTGRNRRGARLAQPFSALSLLLAACLTAGEWKDPEDLRQPQEHDATPSAPATAIDPQTMPDWTVPVPGWIPVQPGEHPRLLLRRGDLPALRQKAASAEGQLLIKHCEESLAKGTDRHDCVWKGALHGLLYQVTGKPEHAKSAWKETDSAIKALEGFARGWGELIGARAAWLWIYLGLSYDLSYDGWDETVRQTMAQRLLALRPSHGGPADRGFLLLALRGDPGVDPTAVDKDLAAIATQVRGAIRQAQATPDTNCGQPLVNCGLLPYLQALRVAGGQDLVSGCPWLESLVLHWVHETGRCKDRTVALRRMAGSDSRPTAGGDFAQGFGILREAMKPALLWTWEHCFQVAGRGDYEAVDEPVLAIFSLVNWPFGMQPRNPADLLPHILRHDVGPLVARNRWTGTEQDIIVAVWPFGEGDASRGPLADGTVVILGGGLRFALPERIAPSAVAVFRGEADGSVVLGFDRLGQGWLAEAGLAPCLRSALAIDFSGLSGSPLLLVWVGAERTLFARPPETRTIEGNDGWRLRMETRQWGACVASALTLGRMEAAPLLVAPERLTIGGRAVSFDGANLIVGAADQASPTAPLRRRD